MADVELVIKIDEEQYEFIRQSMTMDKVKDYHVLLYDICEHIRNGTPLPKGHGDMYDCNDLSKLVDEDFRRFLSRLNLKAPQPIIEADKEESEE